MKIRLHFCATIIFMLTTALRLEAQPCDYDGPRFDVDSLPLSGAYEPVGEPAIWSNNIIVATQAGGSADPFGGIGYIALESFGRVPIQPIQTLISFPGNADGAYGQTGLTADGTTLWGATYADGANGFGTVYDISNYLPLGGSTPAFAAPLSFGPTIGTAVQGMVAGPDGNLYAATGGGGTWDDGTVIQINIGSGGSVNFGPAGNGQPLVIFNGSNGQYGRGKLTVGLPLSLSLAKPEGEAEANNQSTFALYGVTDWGGTNGSGPGTGGEGTVYEVNSDGSGFQTLYVFSFDESTNGYAPEGGMALSGNTLYGTTSGGGCNDSGTIFKMDTDGSNFMVLKSFSPAGYDPATYSDTNSDGDSPSGDLILSGNTLYGTTYDGGTNGGGVVFSISTNGGNFTVLHSFTTPIPDENGNYTNSDGGFQQWGLVLSGRTLYGLTTYGGTNGGGTVFAIVLPPPPSLHIAPSPGNLTISWRASATNYVLQQNVTLNSTTWSNFNGTVHDDGTNNSISLMPTAGSAFFRLLNTNNP